MLAHNNSKENELPAGLLWAREVLRSHPVVVLGAARPEWDPQLITWEHHWFIPGTSDHPVRYSCEKQANNTCKTILSTEDVPPPEFFARWLHRSVLCILVTVCLVLGKQLYTCFTYQPGFGKIAAVLMCMSIILGPMDFYTNFEAACAMKTYFASLDNPQPTTALYVGTAFGSMIASNIASTYVWGRFHPDEFSPPNIAMRVVLSPIVHAHDTCQMMNNRYGPEPDLWYNACYAFVESMEAAVQLCTQFLFIERLAGPSVTVTFVMDRTSFKWVCFSLWFSSVTLANGVLSFIVEWLCINRKCSGTGTAGCGYGAIG